MSDLNDFDVPAGQTDGEILFPPSWQGLRQQIVYLAQFGNSIQVIHADQGGGKTAFHRRLLAAGLGSTTVGVTVAKGAGLVVFFRDVLQEFGLRPDPRATLGELAVSLRGYVQTLHKERSRAVLLVDDAHHLADSELGALVSTLQGQADAGVGLHVVLFAEPGLAARIDALQVLDVAVHDAPLPVFSVAEMHQLLMARQGDVGHVTTEQVQRIWYQSRGLPGAALKMLDHLPPQPPAAEKIMSLRGLPIGHIAALVILCAVLIWAFLVRQADESPSNETLSPEFETAQPVVIPVEPVGRTSMPQAPASGQVPAEPKETTQLLTSPDGDRASHGLRGSAILEAANINPDTGADLDEARLDEAGEAVKVTLHDEAVEVLPAQTSAPAPELALGDVPKPELPPSKQNEITRTLAEKGAARLLSFPGNAYVLQLMAASAEDKLAAYVAEQPNKDNLHAYKTERGGKVLYILVEGYYADKASAQAAVLNLPPQQQKGGPWPKKIEQIHQELRKNH
jgi:DamX protein